MTVYVILDTGPLGKVTNPTASRAATQCKVWLESLTDANVKVVLPAIADYEVRRNLVLEESHTAIERLNTLRRTLVYAQMTPVVMDKAAEIWARLRRAGVPVADKQALDGDVILAAHATVYQRRRNRVIIATENLRHIQRAFASGDVRHWQADKWDDVR